jgi:tetratricopeptide (TPR) repeat protein
MHITSQGSSAQRKIRLSRSGQGTQFMALLVCLAAASLFAPRGNASQTSGNAENQDVMVRQAQIALKQGRYEQAIQAYEKLAKASPRSAEFAAGLGTAYYLGGHPREAVEPLQRALKLKPGVAGLHYMLSASLAESNRCGAAMPGLKGAFHYVTDPHLKRSIDMDGVRCAMSLDEEDAALDFLEDLRRAFPRDAEVLYLTVHVFSDLSTRASQKLLVTDPASYEAEELNAEALEAQGKWDEAAKSYRKVLKMDPNLPGIHYRLGRLILSGPKTPTMLAEAKKEFEAELKIDSHNAGAEFVLGEIAWRSQDLTTAADYLSRAAKDDPTFAAAQMELGRTLITLRKPADAIVPLQSAVKLEPGNPSAHYLLATAYREIGRHEDESKEIAAYQKALANVRKSDQAITAGVTGRKTPAEQESQSHP